MTASPTIPGIPSIPETAVVATLIGTCNPYLPPNWFKKKRIMAPIINFTNNCPIQRIGLLIEAVNKIRIIKLITPTMIIVEFNFTTPISLYVSSFYEDVVQKRTYR